MDKTVRYQRAMDRFFATDGAALANGHASPRLHWRRGHIRHLPSGITWVRPPLVGDGEHGTVINDYVGVM